MGYIDSREKFVTDIFITARIEDWAETIESNYDADDKFIGATIRELETGNEYEVTPESIISAVRRLGSKDGGNYSNSGYAKSSYGNTQQRFGLLIRTWGEESDYDSLDADAIIQLATLGEVVYG